MLTITREQEDVMPLFLNHKSAREWFKSHYGNRFVMKESSYIDGEKVYFYHLVMNRDAYLKGINKMSEGELIGGLDFIDSYQPIEITEDGMVHVIY